MLTRRTPSTGLRFSWLHSPDLHLVLYSLLLVATPFLLLRRFLQSAVGTLGRLSFTVAGLDVPIVATAAVVLAILLLISCRIRLTKLNVIAAVLALLMNALAQQFIDYYADHTFYDLQQNWHYFAYAIFALMMYRVLAPRGISLSNIILTTYCVAVLFSSFDETCQLYISGRAFETNDIAKDAWGSLLGMVFLYLGGQQAPILLARWKQFRQPRLREYVENPFSLLILLILLTFLFLFFAALLTDLKYTAHSILLTLGVFALLFLLLHLSQYRVAKYILIAAFSVAVLAQSYSFLTYDRDHVVYHNHGLTMYRGIPIVFFDMMVFPDGTFRLVDKKQHFSPRDQMFFLRQKADIILIASGPEGQGGRGFPRQTVSQFIYNPYTKRGTQVIILRNSEACPLFNRLKQEQKSVLLILHNTC